MNRVVFDADNDLPPVHHQSISYTNTDYLLIGSLETFLKL